MTDDRLTELEIKFAHQDLAIERLEQAAFDRDRVIEDLAQRLKRLTDKIEALGGNDVGPSDQKPPHY